MRAGSAAVLAAAGLLGGCVHDGRYSIAGAVRRELGAELVPVEGARVDVRPNRRGGAPGATTGADGRYAFEYRFGGMGLLFWGYGDGDPVLSASAPGLAECAVRLRRLEAEEPSPCAWVRPCAPDRNGCRLVEFVLEPDAAAAGASTAERGR